MTEMCAIHFYRPKKKPRAKNVNEKPTICMNEHVDIDETKNK